MVLQVDRLSLKLIKMSTVSRSPVIIDAGVNKGARGYSWGISPAGVLCPRTRDTGVTG